MHSRRTLVLFAVVLATTLVAFAATAAPQPNGSPCTVPSDCTSGFCVGLVCCDSPCNDKGTCSAGIEAPPPKCSTGTCTPSSPVSCGAYGCDPERCKTSCAAAEHCAPGYECKSNKCVPASAACTSDGTTSIGTDGTTTLCRPYRCDPTTGRCRATCRSTNDCTPGSACIGDRCGAPGAKCSDDASTAIAQDGTQTKCHPYLCWAGACLSSCERSSDCAASLVCREFRCQTPLPEEKSSGCGCTHAGAAGSGSAVALAAIVTALARRRRR